MGLGAPEKKKGCEKMIEERRVPPAGGTLPVSLSQQITARSEFESGCVRGKMYPAPLPMIVFGLTVRGIAIFSI